MTADLEHAQPPKIRLKYLFDTVSLSEAESGDLLLCVRNRGSNVLCESTVLDAAQIDTLRAEDETSSAVRPGYGSRLFLRERPDSSCSADFLAVYLNSRRGTEEAISAATGFGQSWMLRANGLVDLEVPVPDRHLQQAIVKGATRTKDILGAYIRLEKKKLEILSQAHDLFLDQLACSSSVSGVKDVLTGLSKTLVLARSGLSNETPKDEKTAKPVGIKSAHAP